MKRALTLLGLVLVTLTACSLSQFNPFRRVIEYPRPEFNMHNTFFADQGCIDSPDCLPDALLQNVQAIDFLAEPSELLGGLSPFYPMARANTMIFDHDAQMPAVYSEGCIAKFFTRYIVDVGGDLMLIDSATEMAALYAPIESEDEALSFALAVTNLMALYDLDQDTKIKHLSKPLIESHSSFDGENFIVHLFDTSFCGCGPHIVQSVDVTVEPDGSFHMGLPVDAFTDPELDGVCFD